MSPTMYHLYRTSSRLRCVIYYFISR